MGQYYYPVIVDCNDNAKTIYAHDFENGLKLTEHSYIGNNFMAAVMNELLFNPHQVWWAGDYSDGEDYPDGVYEKYIRYSDKFELIKPNEENQKWRYDNCCLVNIDKKQYVKLPKNEEDKWQVNPLSLLTAVGNGRGGGDYRGNDVWMVGYWAGDRIKITFEKPITDYTDITNNFDFYEDWMRE